MGQIFAHYTGTRVRWEHDEDGFPFEEPTEEHGWVDRSWSPYILEECRNDVRPIISLDENHPDLREEVEEALEWLEGGYENNGDGTFYSRETYQPSGELWGYSYAIHFVRKFFGPNGWTEEPWSPPAEWLTGR